MYPTCKRLQNSPAFVTGQHLDFFSAMAENSKKTRLTPLLMSLLITLHRDYTPTGGRRLLEMMMMMMMELKYSNVFSLFIACSKRNRPALVRELLSNNSLFVSQLYEDKSLALQARDLIFFTTDLQTVNYYSTIHC